jgi:exodeoxyribonuclease VII large subunit
MEQLSFSSAPSILSVTELTAAVHRLLARQFDDIRVAGEISGFKVWSSGHAYFTLKDAGSQLRCVIFRNALRYLRFKPQDGLAVIARGSIEVRQDRGEYQLIVSSVEPQGFGALQLAFEQLKQKLAAEGLFSQDRKRPLPAFPRRIGIVTSRKGAVIRDMLTVLRRRFPGLHIRLYPTQVQGEGAAAGVCEGLDYFSSSAWADVVLVGRGGGSLEDLWTFNEESVARAIARSVCPVVSAVGHETDFTIADFVADLRAPTPSAAAEMIVRDREELLTAIDITAHRAHRAVRFQLSDAAGRLNQQGIQRASALLQRRIGRAWQRVNEQGHQRLQALTQRHVVRHWQRVEEAEQLLRQHDPRVRLARARQQHLAAHQKLAELMRNRLHDGLLRINPLTASLQALSPLGVLDRGYALVQTAAGALVKQAADAPPGTSLSIRLKDDQLRATVD